LKNNYLSSSDFEFHDDILDEFRDVLRKNGYPNNFIDKVIFFKSRNKNCNLPLTHRKYFSIPFIGRSTIIIRKFLQSLDEKICVSFRNYNTIRDNFFSKTKDRTSLLKDSGIVYMVECSDCPSVYVGETSQSLKKRISQHSNDVKNGIHSTAFSSHALENDHK